MAPHWSHTSASAGAVNQTYEIAYQTSTHTHAFCNCRVKSVHLAQKDNTGKSNTRGTKAPPFRSQRRDLLVTHLCFSGVNTRKRTCRVQWKRGKRHKNTTQDKQKHQTGCNGPSSRQKRAELKSFIYRALLSVCEQWADCLPERPQKDWVFSVQQTLPACGTSLLSKKTLQSQHPKSHCMHCNYSSQFTFGMPLSILMKTQKRRGCTELAETFNPGPTLTSHLHTHAHKDTQTHTHTAVWMWVGSHRDVNRLQIHTGPGLIHWSIFCSAGFKWS